MVFFKFSKNFNWVGLGKKKKKKKPPLRRSDSDGLFSLLIVSEIACSLVLGSVVQSRRWTVVIEMVEILLGKKGRWWVFEAGWLAGWLASESVCSA